MKMEYDKTDSNPKHLRVGVNSAMLSDSAIVRVLIDKGLFTWEEYFEKLLEVTEEEVKAYEKWLSDKLKIKVDLL